MRVARAVGVVFVAVATVHLGAQLAGSAALAQVTQWLLMPTLAVCVLAATASPRPRQVRVVVLALGLSFLGDAAPDLVAGGDASFLVMVGFFLLAQVAYVVAFAPRARSSVLYRPARTAPYAAALVVLVGIVAPHAGTLLVPVAVYAGVLTAMAVLATGLGRWGAVGGAVFLVSDSLIALEAFVPGWSLPAHGFWVMATYCVGQALLAVAVLRLPDVRPQPMPCTGAANGTPEPSRRASVSGSAIG
ncbi:lysoplasmalogenase [Cellulomonas soli]|uniref:lysoplasmalogenase n=1 Tax=Cellulomonas soli TaxID=931535 RepID=UPI003F856563